MSPCTLKPRPSHLLHGDPCHAGKLKSSHHQFLDAKPTGPQQQVIRGMRDVVIPPTSCGGITRPPGTWVHRGTHSSVSIHFREVTGKVLDQILEEHIAVVLSSGEVREIGLSDHLA